MALSNTDVSTAVPRKTADSGASTTATSKGLEVASAIKPSVHGSAATYGNARAGLSKGGWTSTLSEHGWEPGDFLDVEVYLRAERILPGEFRAGFGSPSPLLEGLQSAGRGAGPGPSVAAASSDSKTASSSRGGGGSDSMSRDRWRMRGSSRSGVRQAEDLPTERAGPAKEYSSPTSGGAARRSDGMDLDQPSLIHGGDEPREAPKSPHQNAK